MVHQQSKIRGIKMIIRKTSKHEKGKHKVEKYDNSLRIIYVSNKQHKI